MAFHFGLGTVVHCPERILQIVGTLFVVIRKPEQNVIGLIWYKGTRCLANTQLYADHPSKLCEEHTSAQQYPPHATPPHSHNTNLSLMASGSSSSVSPARGMQSLIQPFFISTAWVTASQLILTTMGRPQRQHGIIKLKAAIEEQGFLESFAPLVTLMSPLQDGVTLESVTSASGSRFKVIDGNHRVAAQAAIDKERGTATKIVVRVHQPMDESVERLVAQGKNMMPGVVVVV